MLNENQKSGHPGFFCVQYVQYKFPYNGTVYSAVPFFYHYRYMLLSNKLSKRLYHDHNPFVLLGRQA